MPAAQLPPSRMRLTAYALEQVLWVVPALLLFTATAFAGVLALFWVGIPLLLLLVPATRWLAQRHRVIAADVLGSPVPSPYARPVRPGMVERVLTWARDPMTWRDLGWLLVTATFGLALSLICVLLLVLVVTGALWWFGVEHLMRLRCLADRWCLVDGHVRTLERRVQTLTTTRARSLDASAAELRRIERDLHDGAQARLVALGISLGMAQEVLRRDPTAAATLLEDAQMNTGAALSELRAVVRGIHPPVLADRGLVGAVRSLALDMGLPVTTRASLAGRPPEPIESAVYFAVAECLANMGKHSRATNGWIEIEHAEGRLTVVVGDDGCGGADLSAGTGLQGIQHRLGAFDGTMWIHSPPDGPTLVTMEVSCDLSWLKTTPSSGTG